MNMTKYTDITTGNSCVFKAGEFRTAKMPYDGAFNDYLSNLKIAAGYTAGWSPDMHTTIFYASDIFHDTPDESDTLPWLAVENFRRFIPVSEIEKVVAARDARLRRLAMLFDIFFKSGSFAEFKIAADLGCVRAEEAAGFLKAISKIDASAWWIQDDAAAVKIAATAKAYLNSLTA